MSVTISPKYKKGDQAVSHNDKFEILDVNEKEYIIEWVAGHYKGARKTYAHHTIDSSSFTLYTGPRDEINPKPKARATAVYDSLTKVPTQQSCTHDFAMYYGFSQNYEYCKKCDFKKR